MKSFNIFVILGACFLLSQAADWNYVKQGTDWLGIGSCGVHEYEQSPIDLHGDHLHQHQNAGTVTVSHQELSVTLKNTGYTMKVSHKEGEEQMLTASLRNLEGTMSNYTAAQFHFHAPSEHTVNGHQSDLCMHIVCTMDDPTTGAGRQYAVVGLLFDEDDSAEDIPMFKVINDQVKLDLAAQAMALDTNNVKGQWDALKSTNNVKLRLADLFNLLPTENNFFHYLGGLTTPTCDEQVNWYVSKHVIRMNKKQLKEFRALWVDGVRFNSLTGQGNNRELQHLGNRKVFGGSYTVQMTRPDTEGSVQSISDTEVKNWLFSFIVLCALTVSLLVLSTLMKFAK